jgi:opacity protein-like surface antigen
VKVLAVPKAAEAAAVVVTERPVLTAKRRRRITPLGALGRALSFVLGFALVLLTAPADAAILPEDRSDVLYHSYDGGGLKVDGPSVLVRKAYKDKVSFWGNYYVDMITSASIDVVTTASPYTEEREEFSLGADYLHGKTTMGASYTNSEESDYSANAARFSINHDFFGDLTNVGITYARGWNEVRRNGDDLFSEDAKTQSYRLDVSQVITRNFLINMNYEGVTDEGFLNNPYRQVRYQDPSAARGYSYEPEIYPRTRTSSAFALRGKYFLPYRAALNAEWRTYSDTWGIKGWNAELGYVHPITDNLTVEAKYRYYTQTKADFYEDLFPYSQSQNYMARDKELSTYFNHTVGAGVSYQFNLGWGFLKRGEVSLLVDHMMFDYQDFRDLRVTDVPAGEEPMFSMQATVVRAFIAFFY